MIAPLRGVRWVQLRHDWRVRWAHHPLCNRHRHETWRVGSMYLCRGCMSLAAGLLGATVAVWTVGATWCVWALSVLLPLVLCLSWPEVYRQLPRALRDLLRAGLGVLIVAATAVLASSPTYGWPLLPFSAWVWWWFRGARQRVLARRCAGCPELGQGICSGFTLHAKAARAISAELELRIEAALLANGHGPAQTAQPPQPPQHSDGTRTSRSIEIG